MSGAAFIIGINLTVGALFAATFVVIALYSRFRSAWWFAGCYSAGVLYLALEAALPLVDDARLLVVLGATSFVLALLLLNVGLAHRYERPVSPTLLAAIMGLSVIATGLTLDMPRDSLLRMFLYQSPFAAMQAVGAFIVLTGTRRGAADTVLGVFLALSAAHFLGKPLLAAYFGGPGSNPQAYIGTTYAMLSQSLGVILSVASALMLLTMMIRDMLVDITRKSETDVLSGLLNRRGFEDRLAEIALNRNRNGLPVALVICDLDHFKAINDTHGHAVGDRVIAAFAATLRANAAEHHVLGRIGGEEFAAILPGSNLAAARLFAEAVRAACSAVAVDAVHRRFTASFGVAEMAPGEPSPILMRRADDALYEAKRTGRDRVCLNRNAPDAGSERLAKSG